jgi:hypothetical protein
MIVEDNILIFFFENVVIRHLCSLLGYNQTNRQFISLPSKIRFVDFVGILSMDVCFVLGEVQFFMHFYLIYPKWLIIISILERFFYHFFSHFFNFLLVQMQPCNFMNIFLHQILSDELILVYVIHG